MLQSDASDAPQRFGAAESPLFDGLKWAVAVKSAFDHGLSDTVRELRIVERAVADLPLTGAPGELRKAVQDDLQSIGQRLAQDDFHKHKADLATKLTELEHRIAEAVRGMRASQQDRLREAEQELQILQEWQEFTQDEQARLLDRLQSMVITVAEDLTGLKSLIARQFDIELHHRRCKKNAIIREGRDRQRERLKPKLPPAQSETGGLTVNLKPGR